MKKDFRIKNYPDLHTSFGDYNEIANLTHYYKLFSADDDSINSTIYNSENGKGSVEALGGRPAIANDISTIKTSPYENIKYSSNIEVQNTSYYRIQYGVDTNDPVRNNGRKMTISMWVSMPNLHENVIGSADQIILSKIKAGESAWGTQGEMKLHYNVTEDAFYFTINGKNTDPDSVVFNQFFDIWTKSKKLSEITPNIKANDWFHITAVLSEDLSVARSGNTTIASFLKMYVNGKNVSAESSGGDANNYAGAITSVSEWWRAFSNGGDILIGRGSADTDAGSLKTRLRVLDLAIWNTDLNSNAINSIYSTSQYFEGSGFLSLGPRVQLKQQKPVGFLYAAGPNTPRVKTFNPHPSIPYSSKYPFDDTNVVIFNSASLTSIQYPTGLPSSNIGKDLRVSASLATPNTLPSMTNIVGYGATANAIVSNNSLTGFSTLVGGEGYTTAPTVSFSGGGGSGAAATTTINEDFIITSLNVTSAGAGYSTLPTVHIPGTGVGAVVDTTISKKSVTGISSLVGGSGYVSVPIVAFTGGGGTGAEATATIGGGQVTGIIITEIGANYSGVPSISFTGGGGSAAGASATAVVSEGTVYSATVTTAGTGYIPSKTGITFSSASGVDAAATVTVAIDGTVTSVDITTPGAGYVDPPPTSTLYTIGAGSGASATPVISNDTIIGAAMKGAGNGYASDTVVSFSGGGGVGAAATATVSSGGAVTGLVITAPGSGYTSNPDITISTPTPATATSPFAAPGYQNTAIMGDYYVPSQVEEGISEFVPFNDALILSHPNTGFYGATTSIHGFNSTVQNKIQIVLELPINEVSNATRHSAHWDSSPTTNNYPYADESVTTNNINPHYDADGEFFEKDLSGLLYYNQSRGVWEQKGLDTIDGPIASKETAQQTSATWLQIINGVQPSVTGHPKLSSGSSNQLRMFYPGGTYFGLSQYPAGGTGLTSNTVLGITDTQLAANVGSPIASNYAPNAIQYHATASQVIKMSDYIQEPFLLEKVVLEIPNTVARKIFDYSSFPDSPTAGRPQDDYVFFLMRQEKHFPGSSPQVPASGSIDKLRAEVSSSMRYLICSGAASFYNSSRRIPGKLRDIQAGAPWQPYNSPSFSRNFNKNIGVGGIGAEAKATVAAGAVTAGTITAPGVGYITAPSVQFFGGGGTGAAATAALTAGSVSGFTITNGGSGYTSPPGIIIYANNDIAPMVASGSIKLEMEPAVASTKVYGSMFVPTWDGTAQLYITQSYTDRTLYHSQSCTVPGFWPGGTSTLPLSGALTGSRSDVYGGNLHLATTSSQHNGPYTWKKGVGNVIYNQRTFFEINSYIKPGVLSNGKVIDSRTHSPFGGGGSTVRLPYLNELDGTSDLTDAWNNSFADDLSKLNSTSPYLLFPEDELVLGLDAALGWTATMAAGVTKEGIRNEGGTAVPADRRTVVGANNLTGSLLRLEANQTMFLRIYGSLVKDQIEAPKFPKHDLNQVDISEPIIGTHVLDQYDISSTPANSGSYRQRLFTGSMTTGIGAARVENTGKEIYGAAVNNGAFTWTTLQGNQVFANDFQEKGGATACTVITCSVPSSLTGLKWPGDWPHPSVPAGRPMEKFYIRFLSSSVTPNYYIDQIMASNPQGTISAAPDEIWCRTANTGNEWANVDWIAISSLYGAFNGAMGSWYNVFGSAFTAASPGSYGGVKGLTAEWTSTYPYTSLGISSTGTSANSSLFLQTSCSAEPYYQDAGKDNLQFQAAIQSIVIAEPGKVTYSPDLEFSSNWRVKLLNTTGASNDVTKWIKVVSKSEFTLYDDQALTIPYKVTIAQAGAGGTVNVIHPNDNFTRPGTSDWILNPPPGNSTSVPPQHLNDDAGTHKYYRPYPNSEGNTKLGSGVQLGIIPLGSSSLAGGLINANPVRALAASAARGNMGEFGAFSRNSTLICSTEKWLDSAPPRITQLWTRMGLVPYKWNLVGTPDDAVGTLGATGDDLELLICGISAGSKSFGGSAWPLDSPFSSDWWGAFPFEPRFNRIPGSTITAAPDRRFGETAVSNNEGGICAAFYWITDDTYPGWGQPNVGGPLSSSLGVDFSYLLPYASWKPAGTYGSAQVGLSLTMDSQTYGLPPHLGEIAKASLKTFFGIGDGVGNLIESSNEQHHYPVNDKTYLGTGAPDTNGIYPGYYRVFRRMKKPRGWKYGLVNALPQFTQAVFRSDHYGQFRDMMEGRKFTVFVDTSDSDNPPNTYQTDPPVMVRFQKPVWQRDQDGAGNPGQWELVDPAETRSGNLDQWATSSLPYFDQCWGDYALYPHGRDRPDLISFDEYTYTLT